MKKLLTAAICCTVILMSFTSCLKDQCTQTISYIEYIPIYKTQAEIDASITSEGPRVMEKPGNIYFYNDFIFINEKRAGIHIIDNSNPSSPNSLGFIKIDGNMNLSIKNNILYADKCTDLVSIDISDLSNIHEVSRVKDIFRTLSVTDPINSNILVYYDEVERERVVDCDATDWRKNDFAISEVATFSNDLLSQSDQNSYSSGSGIGGSFARFTLAGNEMYIVDESTMKVLSVQNPANPVYSTEINLGWGIETIIPYEEYLFIGSNSGMLIYDRVDPMNPQYVGGLVHVQGCDPVYVSGNFAYVTIRDGNICAGTSNQMDLIDISNIQNPVLIESFEMDHPHGLSIKGEELYLCEGSHGFKIFDISDPKELDKNRIKHLKNMDAYDVIALPGNEDVVLIIGKDGFFQYDVSNPKRPDLISSIEVGFE